MATELMRQSEISVAVENSTANMQLIARAAADPSIDAAKMLQLMELQERIMAREAEVAFNAAMARLQPKLPIITKRGKIEFESQRTGVKQSTPYARYEDIDAAIRPLLSEEGFSLSFDSEFAEKGIVYHGTLAHSLGHSKRASMVLPADTSGSKNSLQAIGSTVSYAKRYLVGMLLNIITKGQDDDGQAVGYLTDQEASTIIDMIAACGLTPARQTKFLEYVEAKTVSEIQRKNYQKGFLQLQNELRKVKEGQR